MTHQLSLPIENIFLGFPCRFSVTLSSTYVAIYNGLQQIPLSEGMAGIGHNFFVWSVL